ncbi:MAG: FAD-binding oxidoreductase [Nitrospirae bacterium]|nr:FAD-binding oxidoreductase [Nitrospirota bacterium]
MGRKKTNGSKVAAAFRRLLPATQVSERAADLIRCGRDESSFPGRTPAIVLWPESTRDIQKVIRKAHFLGVPITPRGAGSSLEGNSIPVEGGVVLDVSRMTKVLEFRPEDFLVRVEPGIVYNELNRQIKESGLFFPPSPGGSSDVATIGGMVSTNASGIYSVKFGGTRDYVKALTIVDGCGQVHKLGTSSPKSSSGLDLAQLIVGAEGTLGVVAEVTLRLAPRPESFKKLAFSFADDSGAARAIVALKQSLPELAAVEFLDTASVACVNRFKEWHAKESPTLCLELQGSQSGVAQAEGPATELCREAGGEAVNLGGVDPWEFRHFVTRAIRAAHPGAFIVRNDVGFPVSVLPEMIARCREIERRTSLRLFAFGHAGFGILHVLIPADEGNAAALKKARQANAEIIRIALSKGGIISAEHGIGIGGRKFMRAQHGSSLDLMRQVKRVFDPRGILNPGKVLP